MSRPTIFLIVFVIMLAGGAYYLSSSAREVPTETIETEVEASRD